jgi:hypothetical protein
MSLEQGYLTLRWQKDQVAEALDSAGMTLRQIVETHIVPGLHATKTVNFKYHGVVMDTVKEPDWRARLETLKLVLQLKGALPAR